MHNMEPAQAGAVPSEAAFVPDRGTQHCRATCVGGPRRCFGSVSSPRGGASSAAPWRAPGAGAGGPAPIPEVRAGEESCPCRPPGSPSRARPATDAGGEGAPLARPLRARARSARPRSPLVPWCPPSRPAPAASRRGPPWARQVRGRGPASKGVGGWTGEAPARRGVRLAAQVLSPACPSTGGKFQRSQALI